MCVMFDLQQEKLHVPFPVSTRISPNFVNMRSGYVRMSFRTHPYNKVLLASDAWINRYVSKERAGVPFQKVLVKRFLSTTSDHFPSRQKTDYSRCLQTIFLHDSISFDHSVKCDEYATVSKCPYGRPTCTYERATSICFKHLHLGHQQTVHYETTRRSSMHYCPTIYAKEAGT